MTKASFADVTRWQRQQESPTTYEGHVPPAWLQGRSAFGGIGAAVCLSALSHHVDSDRRLRSFHARYIGPLGAEPATASVEVLRAGRSLTHASARISQAGTTRLTFEACYGTDRESSAVVAGPARDGTIPGPAGLQDMPYVPGLTPTFTQHFAFRWVAGNPPFSASDGRHLTGWCRHRGATADAHSALLALIDAWPSPALAFFQKPAPASTVAWTVNFHTVPAAISTEDWCLFTSDVVDAADGYVTIRSTLFGPSGLPAASSEQLVAVYG